MLTGVFLLAEICAAAIVVLVAGAAAMKRK